MKTELFSVFEWWLKIPTILQPNHSEPFKFQTCSVFEPLLYFFPKFTICLSKFVWCRANKHLWYVKLRKSLSSNFVQSSNSKKQKSFLSPKLYKCTSDIAYLNSSGVPDFKGSGFEMIFKNQTFLSDFRMMFVWLATILSKNRRKRDWSTTQPTQYPIFMFVIQILTVF